MTSTYVSARRYSESLLLWKKIELSIKDFFSKCDQIRRELKKFFMENFILCAVYLQPCLLLDSYFFHRIKVTFLYIKELIHTK